MSIFDSFIKMIRGQPTKAAAIFINHTNHSSKKWGDEQKKAAEQFGRIVDIPFPNIAPCLGTKEVYDLAGKNYTEIMKYNPCAVLCQGEFVYVCKMAELLKNAGVKALAACSERVVTESVDENGKDVKTSVFTFVRFRGF